MMLALLGVQVALAGIAFFLSAWLTITTVSYFGSRNLLSDTAARIKSLEQANADARIVDTGEELVNEISVFGMKAAAHNIEGGARLLVQRTGETSRDELVLHPVEPVVDQMTDFARAIRGEIDVEVTGEVGLAVTAVLEAAVESAATGRVVSVLG